MHPENDSRVGRSRVPRILFGLLVGFVLAACAAQSPVDRSSRSAATPAAELFVGRESRCLPEFPDQDGWFGGDAAYSIPLPTKERSTSLWLFGDTFVERPDSPPGRHYPFVHNSIALTHCHSDGRSGIEYFWGRNAGNEPRAFFEPDPGAAWVRDFTEAGGRNAYYWLFDGFVAHDTLFVGLLRVGDATPRGPFRLPFELLGMDLARIENFREPPEDWEVRISTLSASRVAFPGSAYVVGNGFVYAFAFFDRGDGHAPRILARLDLDALVEWKPDLSPDLETFSERGEWVRGFVPRDARILMGDDASEMSVHLDVESDSWLAVYNIPGPPFEPQRAGEEDGGPTAQVLLRRAPSLEGPWSAPEAILSIEAGVQDRHAESLFCYAAKAHPQFSKPDHLLVTYVCNLFAKSPEGEIQTLERLRQIPEIYRPTAFSVSIPPASAGFESSASH